MKVLTMDLMMKLAVLVLLAVQVPAVTAGDHNQATRQASARERVQSTRKDSKLADTRRQRLESNGERIDQRANRKTGGYVSIISVIVNDALGSANKDIRARRTNAAGKISF